MKPTEDSGIDDPNGDATDGRQSLERLSIRYAYLFADMKGEMEALYASDRIVQARLAAAAEHRRAADEYDQNADTCRKEVREVDLRIAELEAQIRALRGERGEAMGRVHSWVFKSRTKRRQSRQAEQGADVRRKRVLRNECMRRLREVKRSFN